MCTVDGEANWVSDLLQKKNPGLESGVETASDHTSFQLSGIPAVLLMQRGRGYLYHSAADTAEQLDLHAIAAAADSAAAAEGDLFRLIPYWLPAWSREREAPTARPDRI